MDRKERIEPKDGCRAVEILLVEDNPGDVRLTLEAFKEEKIRNHLSVAGDGVEALTFLRREGPYANAPRPDFILLDLNLPKTVVKFIEDFWFTIVKLSKSGDADV